MADDDTTISEIQQKPELKIQFTIGYPRLHQAEWLL
jgi:hypothetical protein